MLRGVKSLKGDAIHATDGLIGKVDEVLFDDAHWTVRYVVVDTGGWLLGRKVLIAPSALGALDWDNHVLNVNITRSQVEHSPDVAANPPVSRQWESEYHDYYGWPYYWSGIGMSSSMPYPGVVFANLSGGSMVFGQPEHPDDKELDAVRDRRDVHLRSSREITGYAIVASDGNLGHVTDFIVDDQTWKICYIAVDTADWWQGKIVLLPPNWIAQAIFPDRTVMVGVTRDQVRNGPEWEPNQPITREFQRELEAYYADRRDSAASNSAVAMAALVDHEAHSR